MPHVTNRHVRREVNAAARQLDSGVSLSELDVMCECGRGGCQERFAVPVSVFDEAVGSEGWFIVAAGHEPHDDRPLRRESGFSLIGPQAPAGSLFPLEPGLAGID